MSQGLLRDDDVVARSRVDAAREGFSQGVAAQVRGGNPSRAGVHLHKPVDPEGTDGTSAEPAREKGRVEVDLLVLAHVIPLLDQPAERVAQRHRPRPDTAAPRTPSALEVPTGEGHRAQDDAVRGDDVAQGERCQLAGSEAGFETEAKEQAIPEGYAGQIAGKERQISGRKRGAGSHGYRDDCPSHAGP